MVSPTVWAACKSRCTFRRRPVRSPVVTARSQATVFAPHPSFFGRVFGFKPDATTTATALLATSTVSGCIYCCSRRDGQLQRRPRQLELRHPHEYERPELQRCDRFRARYRLFGLGAERKRRDISESDARADAAGFRSAALRSPAARIWPPMRRHLAHARHLTETAIAVRFPAITAIRTSISTAQP